jgi:hypothetical protein
MFFRSGGKTTMLDVIAGYNSLDSIPGISVSDDGSRIAAVGGLREQSFGGAFQDGWTILVNGRKTDEAPDLIAVEPGDVIVICYGDPSLFQYPEIDLTRMMTDGIVKFTSLDETQNDDGETFPSRNPVVGASVVWDGMKYTTDTDGEIIIDSTGAGIRHTVSIERYCGGTLPTVLRFAPGTAVMYGYEDVPADAWFFNAVMFVSEKNLINGVSETEFGPASLLNKAMFVTILGRMAHAVTDPNAETGFRDVVSDGWSPGYILWARQNGIAAGNEDGTFGQYQVLTREQIAVLLYRFAVMSGFDISAGGAPLSAFEDAGSLSPYAVQAMRWATAHGIVTGSSGQLAPLGAATRAQTAVMLERFIAAFMP